jgi:chromosome segregation ATPase
VKKTLKKITQVFKNEIQTRFNRHYDNIEKGEKIIIDGKEFVKVKLKFVDTMDFNLAKHVDNIESENDLLKKELNDLKGLSEKDNLKIEQLQICVKNMFHENTRLKEQNQKDEIVSKLNRKINEQNETIEMHERNISGQGKKIKELEAENKKFNIMEKTLMNEIKLYNGQIAKLTDENEKIYNKLKTLTKETEKLEKSDKTAENELRNNQILIETLTEKLFTQKNEIEYLRTKLKKKLTTTANPQ